MWRIVLPCEDIFSFFPSPGIDLKNKTNLRKIINNRTQILSDISLFEKARGEIFPKGTMIAITGTNGKTSVCSFLTQIWEKSNFSAASLGTLGLTTTPKFKSLKIKDGLTTLDPVNLHSCISANTTA